jgi:hypothetical protein
VNKFGSPISVDLTDAVGTWSTSRQLDPPPSMGWTSPADAPLLTIAAQFVDAVLKLGSNADRPSDGLMSMVAYNAECYLSWSEMEDRNLSGALVLSSCVPYEAFGKTKELAQASAAEAVSDLVEYFRLITETDDCADMHSTSFLPRHEGVMMAKLVEALPQTGSCVGGCPFGRPLCNGTTCVRPTCDDIMPLCNAGGNAGALARYACGVTCGCDSPTSALVWTGPNSGCRPTCQEAARSAARNARCSDAQPGSAEFAALATYSRAKDQFFISSVNATVKAALGCFALNFDFPDICDADATADDSKSFVPFCPVTCGCIDDPSRPGCPGTCDATDAAEPPTPVCRDLSDAQLVLASDTRVAWYKLNGLTRPDPYPPSCVGANETVCAHLGIDLDRDGGRLPAWKHPCPVACNACL